MLTPGTEKSMQWNQVRLWVARDSPVANECTEQELSLIKVCVHVEQELSLITIYVHVQSMQSCM